MKFRHIPIKTKDFVGITHGRGAHVAINAPGVGKKHVVLHKYSPVFPSYTTSRHHSDVTLIPLQKVDFAVLGDTAATNFAAGMEFSLRMHSKLAQLEVVECILVVGDEAGSITDHKTGNTISSVLVGLAFEVKDIDH